MSDKPDIDAIKARLAAATPGPWALVDFPVMFPRVQSIAEDKSNICETWGWADAKFIAAAPADIAALLAEVAALRARLTLTPEKVEAAVAAWWSTGWARTVAESDSQMNADIRRWLRAALLAAGMTEEALQ